jgi:hypothetical protein
LIQFNTQSMTIDPYMPVAIIAVGIFATSFIKYRQWQFVSLIIVSIAYGFIVSQAFMSGQLDFELGAFLTVLFMAIMYQCWKFYSKFIPDMT